MELFAEAEAVAHEAGWVLGALSMILTAVFGYLNNRLKVQTDQKLAALEERARLQDRELADCQHKHTAADRAASEALARVAHLEEQNGGQQSMIDNLTARIVSLVSGLRQSGLPVEPGTAEHKPL